ncbi:MAG: nucleoside hydrolase [Candidatus Levybacteria bacterium]|nr:nucleoside hydrolase [Candidatus Levybacteria bacterium]
MKNIIIDTDAGHDDALAILLLIKSRAFNIKAITTVAGNSTLENVTRNAFFIRDFAARTDIPIYSGYEKPLKRELVLAVVHGASGLDGMNLANIQYKLTHDADKQLIRLIKENPNKISLLTIGPLTNIARAFLKEPKLPGLLKQIVIMGGAIDCCGNKNRVAEFNIFVDPEAADIVFRAKVPKVLIPIDVCSDMPLFLSDFEKLHGSELYALIMKMMREFIKGIEAYEGTKGALVYDAIAAYYLLNPKAFVLKPMDIVIETKGEYTRGMTVVEKRIAAKKMHNAEVAVKVNREKFVSDLIKMLRK